MDSFKIAYDIPEPVSLLLGVGGMILRRRKSG